ncbi:MAG TPA: FUSC family protein [Candidatus Baltobacteraceae bacterium]|jgi:hypothetical protein|nr:FUSC family protein [Candidatus Baltobacteraceae bacterium]
MSIADVRDRVIAADPGLVRLYMAMRATAAVGTALGLLLALRSALHFPLTVPLLGAALGMTWTISVNDLTLREQRSTTLALWPAAALCVTVGTLTAANRYLSDSLFVGTLFLSIYARRYGPRGAALGTIGVIAFFFALFLHAAARDVPWLVLALAITALCTYAYRFIIFPDRPRLALANALAAFQARQRLIERARTVEQRTHHLYRLNEIALILDDLLAAPRDRRTVLQAEIAAACGASEPLRVDPSAPVRSDWTARGPFRIGTTPDTGRIAPTTRQAVQLTAAAIPAILIGEFLSPQRWYWAALAAFVTFLGTSSSGETRVKAWSRVFGTALGVVAGIVVAYPVRGHDTLAFCLVLVCLFAAVYTVRLSYAVMIFFLTILLSMLYVLLGLFSDQLLLLRLEETALGAVFGGLAASVVLPIPTGQVLLNVSREALQRLNRFIEAAVRRLTGDQTADPLTALRTLDEALQSVRTQIEPLVAQRHLARISNLRMRLTLLMACGHYARALADLAYEGDSDSPATELERLRERIATDIGIVVTADQTHAASLAAPESPPQHAGKALTYLYRIDAIIHKLAKTLAPPVQTG